MFSSVGPTAAPAQQVTFRNDSAGPRRLTVEPWATEYVVAPGNSVTVVFTGPSGETAETREVADGWVVFGWVGSTCSVVVSNGDTIDACDYGVPQVPAGASVRSFVTTMFKSGSK